MNRLDANVREETEVAIVRVRRLGESDRARGSAIMSIVAVVESVVDSYLASEIGRRAKSFDAFESAMLAKVSDGVTQSWSTRREWLRKGFGVSVDQQSWEAFYSVIEVRNALAHGDGVLTSRQLKDAQKAIALRKRIESNLGIQVAGTRLLIDERAVRSCALVAQDYLRAFDYSVLSSRKS